MQIYKYFFNWISNTDSTSITSRYRIFLLTNERKHGFSVLPFFCSIANLAFYRRLIYVYKKKGCCIISILWRKDRDSNPGTRQAGQRFSRPPRSTTPASFLDKQDFTATFSSLKPSFSVCKDSNFFSYARKKIFL